MDAFHTYICGETNRRYNLIIRLNKCAIYRYNTCTGDDDVKR